MSDLPPASASKSAFTVKARSFVRSASSSRAEWLRAAVWIRPLVALVVLATIGWFLRQAIEDVLREDLASELQALLETDVKALSLWLETQEANAVVAAGDLQVIELSRKLVEASADPGADQLTLLQMPEMQMLRDELRATMETRGYMGFVVISPEGVVVGSGRNDNLGAAANLADVEHVVQRALRGEAVVSRPFPSQVMLLDRHGVQRAGVPTMFALAPIRDSSGVVLAVLGLRISPEQEFAQILAVARAGETGETYAFDGDGLLLSQSRFDEQLREIGLLTEKSDSILNVALRDPGVDLTAGERPAKKRSDQPLTRMAAAATAREDGVDVTGYRDYRGAWVAGAWTWLEEYEFGVATEIDAAEAFRPLRILRAVFFSLFGMLIAASVAIWLYSLRTANLRREARKSALEAKQLGQYSLETKLGEGGMGVVYRARHALLHRPTAVKFLDVEKTNPQTVARFEREVQLTSRLNHPNTIAIYDYGRTAEGIFYYAMEYLDGINLDDLVRRYGPQPDGRVVHILQQVCGSLHEAHSIGLIHRDIKPANIVLNHRGGVHDVVKLLDFGLVKAVDAQKQASLTSAGGLTGTPLYLSPEAVQRPESVDARSDLYAVGAVAYFLLTGTPVFDGVSVLEIIQHHSATPPEPPSQRLGQPVSDQLEQLILRCLAKDAGQRPASAQSLARELAACTVLHEWSETDAERWWRTHHPRPEHQEFTPSTSADEFGATLVSAAAHQTPP